MAIKTKLSSKGWHDILCSFFMAIVILLSISVFYIYCHIVLLNTITVAQSRRAVNLVIKMAAKTIKILIVYFSQFSCMNGTYYTNTI